MSLDQRRTADVIVAGGGVFGCATAYHLAKEGVEVLLLERDFIAAGASGASAGMISTPSDTAEWMVKYILAGHRLLHDYQDELEVDYELVHGGSFYLGFTEQDCDRLRAQVERSNSVGLTFEYLEASEVLDMEPHYNPALLGASFNPVATQVNPMLVTFALAQAAGRHGAEIRTGVRVLEIESGPGDKHIVRTNVGIFEADWVVDAAGAWAPELLRRQNISIPVWPSRGQVVLTEPLPTITERMVHVPGRGYVRQTASGNFFIGSHQELVGFDKKVTLERIAFFANTAVMAIPMLANARLLRAHAGMRPMSPDQYPIIGPVPGHERILMATGASGTGIQYGPICGLLTAEYISKGQPHLPWDKLSVRRFSEGTVDPVIHSVA